MEPRRDGEGYYSATWSFGVGVTVSAATRAATRKLAHVYAKAIQQSLLQRRSLHQFTRGLDWEGERYDALGTDSSRSQAIVVNNFTVQVGRVVSVAYGPNTDEPPEDYDYPYVATDVSVEVDQVADLPV